MSRSYLTAARLAQLEASLSDVDRSVLLTLREVRAATARQLCRLHCMEFAEPSRQRQCARLLARLTELRLIARLDRQIGGVRAGSSGFVYALDVAGHRILRGRPKSAHTPGLLFLRHTLTVSELYVRLVEADREGELELLRFEAEPAAWRRFDGGEGQLVLKPDAFVRLGVGSDETAAFVEIDLGTESITALARKFDVYRRYWQSGTEQHRHGLFPSVVWMVADAKRKQRVVDIAALQPAETWPLYRVALFEDAVPTLTS